MKINRESADFIDFTNLNPGKTWHLDLMPWPKGHEVVWTVQDRQHAMDHVEARKVSRVLRAHFLAKFRSLAADKRQPDIEAGLIGFCDRMDAMAKECLRHNRTVKA